MMGYSSAMVSGIAIVEDELMNSDRLLNSRTDCPCCFSTLCFSYRLPAAAQAVPGNSWTLPLQPPEAAAAPLNFEDGQGSSCPVPAS